MVFVATLVRICINKGADVNNVDSDGQTPLFYATTNLLSVNLVPILVDAGEYQTLIEHLIEIS